MDLSAFFDHLHIDSLALRNPRIQVEAHIFFGDENNENLLQCKID